MRPSKTGQKSSPHCNFIGLKRISSRDPVDGKWKIGRFKSLRNHSSLQLILLMKNFSINLNI